MATFDKNKKKTEQKEQQEFAKGVSVSVVETKFGDIIKLGVNLEQFCENPINDAGFVNIELKKSKKGDLYAVLQKNFNK